MTYRTPNRPFPMKSREVGPRPGWVPSRAGPPGRSDWGSQAAEGGQRLADPVARAVPAAIGRGQVHRHARAGGAACRAWTGPGQHQGVLALEEPVAAHSAGSAALGRVLPVRG